MGVPQKARFVRIIRFMERKKQSYRQYNICFKIVNEKTGILILVSYYGGIMYTVKGIKELGYRLLDMEPSVVQKYRILKDFIGIDRNSSEFIKARKALYESEQYLELEAARESHGMWGQYHTEKTKIKRVFKTTEVAMKRCQSLGLDIEDQIIKKLLESIVGMLTGEIQYPDNKEVTNVWMDTGFRWPLVSGIARLDRFNPILDKPWSIMAELVMGSFKSGRFRQQDHDDTFMKLVVNELTNAQKKRLSTIQFIGTGGWPLVVGATNNKLPYNVEKTYINWLINKPEGIYGRSPHPYKRIPAISERDFMGYMRVQSLLAPFRAWKEGYGEEVLDNLGLAAGLDGLWYPDRGAKSLYILKSYEMHQLADNWRNPIAAKIDFSIFILDFIMKALST